MKPLRAHPKVFVQVSNECRLSGCCWFKNLMFKHFNHCAFLCYYLTNVAESLVKSLTFSWFLSLLCFSYVWQWAEETKEKEVMFIYISDDINTWSLCQASPICFFFRMESLSTSLSGRKAPPVKSMLVCSWFYKFGCVCMVLTNLLSSIQVCEGWHEYSRSAFWDSGE